MARKCNCEIPACCRDINKLFELLNKHVNQPVSYPKHEIKKTKKKKKKEKVKTRITNFRIPQIKHNKPHVVQRKKIIEVKQSMTKLMILFKTQLLWHNLIGKTMDTSEFFLGFCKYFVPSTTDVADDKNEDDLSPEVFFLSLQRCANDAAGVFALFALAATSINVMIDFAFT